MTTLEARKILSQGCTGYLAHVVDKRVEEKLKIDDVPIVRDFPEVFLEDLPSLLPYMEIEFEIDLVLGMKLISKTPYKIAPAELKGLHKKVQEL